MSATFITSFAVAGPGPRVAVKDLIDMAGVPTTAGSRVVAQTAVPAAGDAACLAGLRAAGAQVVGRTNLHELALGVTGINPWFGTPVNPLDPSLAPGGSSSGSAVAVATGEAAVAYGTDTGGSIRIPAACCGVCGLKTTWGRIPVTGVRPLAPSLDTVGPMAADVAGLVEGMRLLEPGFAAAGEPGAPRVGRLRIPAAPEVDDAVTAALRATSWAVTDLDPADWLTATRWTLPILVAEAYQSNRDLLERHAGQISPDVAQRLDAGRRLSPADLAAATEGRAWWRARVAALFERYDLLVSPTLLILPPTLDRGADLLEARATLPVNLAGLPALAVPVPARGPLPASLQLVSAPGTEERLLAAGAVVEAAAAA
ncbi:MAG TPA: amidase [Streptosporangiaceae bacterium]|nr:amidase [Streptosporangiaceae bacterium]